MTVMYLIIVSNNITAYQLWKGTDNKCVKIMWRQSGTHTWVTTKL